MAFSRPSNTAGSTGGEGWVVNEGQRRHAAAGSLLAMLAKFSRLHSTARLGLAQPRPLTLAVVAAAQPVAQREVALREAALQQAAQRVEQVEIQQACGAAGGKLLGGS